MAAEYIICGCRTQGSTRMQAIRRPERCLLIFLIAWISSVLADPTILRLYEPPKPKPSSRPQVPPILIERSSLGPLPSPVLSLTRPPPPPPEPPRELKVPPPSPPPQPKPKEPEEPPVQNALPREISRIPKQETPKRKSLVKPLKSKPKQTKQKAPFWNLSRLALRPDPPAISPVVWGAVSLPRATHERWILPVTATAALVTKICHSQAVRRAFYFWWKAGPIVGHYLFAQWWLQITKAPAAKRHNVYHHLHHRYCNAAMDLVLHLRGLHVKLGQVLSTRPDFLPTPYLELFETLQDAVPQWPMERVKDVVTRNLKEQCGVEWDDVFVSMDDKALGSASIGQVHRAVLTDEALSQAEAASDYRGGPQVAVKVMHPGVEEMFRCDFQVFRWLCRLALPEWKGFLTELQRGMMTEFDYLDEAQGLSHVRENMAHSPYWDHVRVPEPVQYLTSKEVLVMELLTGPKLMSAIQEELVAAFGDKQKAEEFISARKQEILHGKQSDADSLSHILHDISFAGKLRLRALVRKCRRYIKTLVDVHGHQIFVDACFNGDPHFGNILLLDHDRLGLIDFGVTRRLGDKERIGLAKIVSALGSGRDDAVVAQAMWDLGFALGDRDDDVMMVKYAKLFFESDQESEDQGFATPQHYFSSLMDQNPLVHIPDPAVFVARISFLFRGMGSAVGWGQVNCCARWCKQAQQALMMAGVEGGGIGNEGDACYSMSLRPVR